MNAILRGPFIGQAIASSSSQLDQLAHRVNRILVNTLSKKAVVEIQHVFILRRRL